jgi:hypothetical protein
MKAALKVSHPFGAHESRSPGVDTSHSRQRVTQSAELLPSQYGLNLKISDMRVSPLYAMSDVFRLAVCSSNQYANLLKSEIEYSMDTVRQSEPISITDMRFMKETIDDHVEYLREVIEFLNTGCESWVLDRSLSVGGNYGPGNISRQVTGLSMFSSNNGRSGIGGDRESPTIFETTRAELLKDFSCVLRRMESLAGRCMDRNATILNGAMLRESQNAISQAEEVKNVSKVLFAFAPLSFTVGIFGMNFVDLGWQAGVSIFIGLSVVMFLFTTQILLSGGDLRRLIRGRTSSRGSPV